jgi:hypothetical protein
LWFAELQGSGFQINGPKDARTQQTVKHQFFTASESDGYYAGGLLSATAAGGGGWKMDCGFRSKTP